MHSVPSNRLVVAGCYLLLSAFVFGMWVWGAETPSTALNGDPRSTLSDLIYGKAHKPFVERAFVPFITCAVHSLAPTEFWTTVRDGLLTVPKVRKETQRLGWEVDYLPEYLIALCLSFVALLGFPFVLRSLFSTLYTTYEGLGDLIPLAGLLALPPFFHSGTHYIYDFPSLLFFTAGLLLMLKQRWPWFYCVYVVGLLNKETMALMPVAILLLYYGRFPRRRLLLHVGAQVLIFAAVKTALVAAFWNNPGQSLEFHLHANIHNLLLPYTFGTFVLWVLVVVLFRYDFGAKHEALHRLAWLLVPFLALTMVFAYLHEIRDMYEVFPVYFLLMVHTVVFSWLKRPFRLNEGVLPRRLSE